MSAYVSKIDFSKMFPNSQIPSEEIELYLKTASVDIDSLTFNRIVACGFDSLTQFQKEKVQNAVCRQAELRFQNKELFESVIQSYSINGVSVTLDKSRLITICGATTSTDIYSELKQSGLCVRRL